LKENRAGSVGLRRYFYDMSTTKWILAAALAFTAAAPVRAEHCCDRARAQGRQCDHPCCIKAAADGRRCHQAGCAGAKAPQRPPGKPAPKK
jgi:hypothetical protein